MESNNNNINYGQGQQPPRKRKLDELAYDGEGQPEVEEGEQEQQLPPENLTKKHCYGQQGDDALENLHLESLSREDLVKLVRKLLVEKNEAQETTKKEVEESTSRQAEEFSQRIIQLEQEKAEVHAKLDKKVSEIVEMHKEVEEKSEALAEKAKQIDTLLVQLNESSHLPQSGLPTDEQQMKIQLSLETWYDWLAFVPRHQLGKIVPQIGDRKFGSIIQKFLHEYSEIAIGHIEIVAPYEEDPSGHPRVRTWQNNHPLRFEMAETQIPTNIKNIKYFILRYFNQSVLNFIQKFQQNGFLENVCLWIGQLTKDIVQSILCHLLPLINGIASIGLIGSVQLLDIYDAENSKEINDLYMKMMEETRILALSKAPDNLHAKTIDLYCRWLYQTARADGKPRVMFFELRNVDSALISLFIERIKKDFLMATDSITFFIRIRLPKAFQFQPQENFCLDNGKTKDRLLTKMEEADPKWEELILLISRYPLESTKKWIVENEKEVMNWEFSTQNCKRIYLSR